ncbi:MAG: helix-hairpin-helix domain-containing protein [candidate division WOR-3 bacterium]|nr:helix-hairpin-helix domain-containing protein [candidate division WOR-3 bacterium]
MNNKEKAVLIFLSICLLVGAGISFLRNQIYQRNLEKITLTATNSRQTEMASADSLESETANLFNINTASQKELEALPNIGPVLAQRIIEYRKIHQGFKCKEDLLKVSGIGPKKYFAIKEKITID